MYKFSTNSVLHECLDPLSCDFSFRYTAGLSNVNTSEPWSLYFEPLVGRDGDLRPLSANFEPLVWGVTDLPPEAYVLADEVGLLRTAGSSSDESLALMLFWTIKHLLFGDLLRLELCGVISRGEPSADEVSWVRSSLLLERLVWGLPTGEGPLNFEEGTSNLGDGGPNSIWRRISTGELSPVQASRDTWEDVDSTCLDLRLKKFSSGFMICTRGMRGDGTGDGNASSSEEWKLSLDNPLNRIISWSLISSLMREVERESRILILLTLFHLKPSFFFIKRFL